MNGNNRADWISRNNEGRERHQLTQVARGCVFLRSRVSSFPQGRGSFRAMRRKRMRGKCRNRRKAEMACELQRYNF
jgi:hypothetical protein